MDTIALLTLIYFIVSLPVGYTGLKKLINNKESFLGGTEFLLFVIALILLWINLLVPGFWQ